MSIRYRFPLISTMTLSTLIVVAVIFMITTVSIILSTWFRWYSFSRPLFLPLFCYFPSLLLLTTLNPKP